VLNINCYFRQHTLIDVLQGAREYASASNDKILQNLVYKTEDNLKILAEHNKVDPEKNYSEFLRDVAFVSFAIFFLRISSVTFIRWSSQIATSIYYDIQMD